MKILKLLFFTAITISCNKIQDVSLITPSSTPLTQRTQSYIWDICRPTNESDATYRVTATGYTTVNFTPSCGSPDCVDDGSGTLSSQSQVVIVCNSNTLSWNSGTCTLTLPANQKSFIRQTSSGTCQTHGFDFDPTSCPSTPDGDIYIKSQVYPNCTPYVNIISTSCVVITAH
ncbi:MAG: hypothetical protein U0V49_03025 [Saprospiraceae bacterium]